jgi:hypothetical protein
MKARWAVAAVRAITQGRTMLGTVLVVLLILAVVGTFPRWGHSRNWGYGPSGILGVLLVIILVLALTGNM